MRSDLNRTPDFNWPENGARTKFEHWRLLTDAKKYSFVPEIQEGEGEGELTEGWWNVKVRFGDRLVLFGGQLSRMRQDRPVVSVTSVQPCHKNLQTNIPMLSYDTDTHKSWAAEWQWVRSLHHSTIFG